MVKPRQRHAEDAEEGSVRRVRNQLQGVADTLESLFGSAPIPPSAMTKRLWGVRVSVR
jgi:hypothetical protein